MKTAQGAAGRAAMQDPAVVAKWRRNHLKVMRSTEMRQKLSAAQRRSFDTNPLHRIRISRGQKRRHQLRYLQKAVDSGDIDGARAAIAQIAALDREAQEELLQVKKQT